MHKSMKKAVPQNQIAMPPRTVEDDAMVCEVTFLSLNVTKTVLLGLGWFLVWAVVFFALDAKLYMLPVLVVGAALHWAIEVYHRSRRSAHGPWSHLNFMVMPKSLYFLFQDATRLAHGGIIVKPLSEFVRELGVPMVRCPHCGVRHVFHAVSEHPDSPGERTCGFDGCTATVHREGAYHD